MIKDGYINMRVNNEIKKESEGILNELGLSLSTAIDLYLMQIIKERGIPFEIKLLKEEEAAKRLKLAKVVNSLGGVDIKSKYQRIINLYAKGDISYDVAVYAIKEALHNE
ncbi:MAG: type II toxin-antitoxin system RelB/DinJ family antitoxin [Acholeplasmataceae bacterium]|nr:type II toxin-antitoxin system RelB/DinJ family antitoxin [Acholeplasmataceae bacterium]